MRTVKRSGRIRRSLGLLLALGLVLAACGDGDEGAAAPPPDVPQEVRFLIAENFWADWRPYSSTAQSQRRVERHMYDMLVQFPDGDLGNPQPMLATSWEIVSDTVWEFELRDDVVFHDGQPLTAADVKASIELASGFSGDSAYSLGWAPAQVEIVDDHTVRISTEEPFAPMLAELSGTPIVSAAWLEGDESRLESEPNGTGAFKLVGDEVNIKTMEANQDYWGQVPFIDTLTWEFIQDPQTRMSALLSGQAHAIDRVPPEQIATLEADENVVLNSVTGVESVNLWVPPGRSQVWEENPDFRLAINLSFDRQPLVDNLVMGGSAVAGSFLPNNTEFYVEQEPAFTADLDRARELLDAADLPEEAKEFEIWVAEGFLPRAVPVVEAIASQMEAIGLRPRIVSTDVAGLIDDAFSENGTGTFYHLSWASSGDANPAAVVYSSAFAWYFGDERLQELIDLGRTTLDPAERAEIYAELQSHMWEQAWHVPLYNSDLTVAHVNSLEGLVVLPQSFVTNFHQAFLAD
ncbi:MAG: ABC transporter substrate-binding protein [Nitriliruptoraceae bacterium]